MFVHKGKTRTEAHNIGIATLLSFVAGLVNVCGFFAVGKLTTNVTGHFAFFVDEAFKMNFLGAFHVALFVFSFFLGAFVSSFTEEVVVRIRTRLTYIIPALAEAIILGAIALGGDFLIKYAPDFLAFMLLFTMGMQNALVTAISHSVVRTTHLTGLFTDMGIEFSQLFFIKSKENITKIVKSIRLRLIIIWSFFFGGVTGGILFSNFGIRSLLLGTILLLGGVFYDLLKIKVLLLKRKI